MKKMDALVRFAASSGFVGHIPWAPGTWGSVVGLGIASIAGSFLPHACLVLTLIGFAICRKAVQVYGSHDPKQFVLDETVGMMIALVGLPRMGENVYALWPVAFLLFRVLDIWKPWPIALIQKSPRPISIMMDDVVAGISANILIRLCFWFLHGRAF